MLPREKIDPQDLMDAQDLIDHFWSDCFKNSGEDQHPQAVGNLLRRFRKTLHSSSETAIAIDRGGPLDEIIHCAEKERFMEMAQFLRFYGHPF